MSFKGDIHPGTGFLKYKLSSLHFSSILGITGLSGDARKTKMRKTKSLNERFDTFHLKTCLHTYHAIIINS